MTRTIAPAALALIGAVPAHAHAQPGWEDGYGHMMWGGGFGLLGGLMMLVFWAAIIAAVVLGVRWLMEREQKSRRPDALDRLVDPAEMTLVKSAALFPRVVVNAAVQQEPHRVAFFLHELASDFHALWTRGNEDAGLRFLRTDEPELSRARLAMLVQQHDHPDIVRHNAPDILEDAL